MIRFGFKTEAGQSVVVLGLTDVNLSRLQDDQPIRVQAGEFVPPGEGGDLSEADIVVFYASRASILELAELWKIDPKEMLDMLAEG